MKKIKGYDNYFITPSGRVFNVSNGTERKLVLNKKLGYYQIDLYKNNKRKKYYIHRLVAETYIDNPTNLPEVNHKDSNRLNNSKDNLEWVTSKGNSNHAVMQGRRDHLARMKIKDIEKAYDLVLLGYSYKQISSMLSNSWKPGFLSVKVKQYALKNGKEVILATALKEQAINRALKNLESINNV